MDWLLLAARGLLAAIFLLSGATKLVDPLGSRRALRDFGVPATFTRLAVLLLPLAEFAVAFALLPAALAWYGAFGALLLYTVFSLAAAIAMARGRRPDCHCFGRLYSKPVGWPLLARNAAFAAVALWVLSFGAAHTGPNVWAWVPGLSAEGRKVALAAAFLATVGFALLLNQARPGPVRRAAPPPPEPEPEVAPKPARVATATAAAPPVSTAYTGPTGPVPMGVGHPIGTPAPEFNLPALAGGHRTLASLVSEFGDIILVFTSPYCESCHTATNNIAIWMKEIPGLPTIVIVSLGKFAENFLKLPAFDPALVLIQYDFEVAASYDCDSTPTAVHVGADGLLRSELAVSGAQIKKLLLACSKTDAGNAPPPQPPL